MRAYIFEERQQATLCIWLHSKGKEKKKEN
jgi:hypothetical protein